jgi:hypothetical protein
MPKMKKEKMKAEHEKFLRRLVKEGRFPLTSDNTTPKEQGIMEEIVRENTRKDIYDILSSETLLKIARG